MGWCQSSKAWIPCNRHNMSVIAIMEKESGANDAMGRHFHHRRAATKRTSSTRGHTTCSRALPLHRSTCYGHISRTCTCLAWLLCGRFLTVEVGELKKHLRRCSWSTRVSTLEIPPPRLNPDERPFRSGVELPIERDSCRVCSVRMGRDPSTWVCGSHCTGRSSSKRAVLRVA